MRILKTLSLLLSYPTAELAAALPELRREIAAAHSLRPAQREALERLASELAAGDLLDVEERYVALFDRVRSLSLHLFEHVYGDSRDRGTAMVGLIEIYRKHGLESATGELPDYLPLYLEFLATLPAAQSNPMLADAADTLDGIHARLAARGSAYAAVFAALLHLACAKVSHEPAKFDPDEDSYEALDRAWEEAAVRFGPDDPSAHQNGSACPRADALVARMNGNP